MLRKYTAVVTFESFYATDGNDARDTIVQEIETRTPFVVSEVQITPVQ